MRRLIVLLVCACALGAPAAQASAPQPAGDATVADFFTPEEIARARAYTRPRYALRFSALGVSLVVLVALAFGPVARRLRSWSARVAPGRARRAVLMVAIVTVVPVLATLPFGLGRHAHDRRFGLATNATAAYLRDVGVAVAFELGISLVAALAFLWAARRLPRAWPAAVAAGGAGLTFLLVLVLPVVYEPAFNTFRPVDAATHGRVVALAARAGVPVDEVLVSDASRRTTAHNAYVSGLGPTKRVVLYDTLLAEAPAREVDLVVAHELAHVVHDDVLRGSLYGAGGLALGVAALALLLRSSRLRAAAGVRDAADPALIPFLALFIALAGLLTSPAQNAISRHAEARADATAIALTGDPDTAVAVEVRLARENIADLEPNGFIAWAFFTHPPTMERIRAALSAGER